MGTPVESLNISEEYYQISDALFSSFSKYRPPLAYYEFDEKVAQLVPFSAKDVRLTAEQSDMASRLCSEGNLFLSRSDYPVYSKHILKQLDLILVDTNLKEGEVADLCCAALHEKLSLFIEQPVKPSFDLLAVDVHVTLEYLWSDLHRLKLLLHRLWCGEYSLVHHLWNSMTVGLFLFAQYKGDTLTRQDFGQAALALLLHDAGMSKIPAFIVQKTGTLTPDEKNKILQHVLLGVDIMHKMGQTFPLMDQAAFEHHERLDGSGYPQRKVTISDFGRLTAVADAFSAMIQTRPYAEAKDMVQAARELSQDSRHFDPAFAGQLLAGVVAGTFGKISVEPS